MIKEHNLSKIYKDKKKPLRKLKDAPTENKKGKKKSNRNKVDKFNYLSYED